MKRRLLSLVLASSMLLSSLNVAYANEAPVSDVLTNVTDGALEVTDVVTSDEAVVFKDEPVVIAEPTGINWVTTEPWQAAVFGDCGGQPKIDNYGDPNYSEYSKVDGVTVYPYHAEEIGKDVNLRMGVFNTDGTVVESQGKIAGGTEGRVMYYRQMTAADDFTISATAHVNDIVNNNNQVSFGLAVLDDIKPNVAHKDIPADSVNAGVRQMAKGVAGMSYAWTRTAGTIADFVPTLDTTTLPQKGDDIDISIKKSGTTYTVKFGDETTTIDGSFLSMKDDIYVGLYACRAVDITFKNINMSVVGEEVDVSANWETNGNGLNADPDKLASTVVESNADNSEISLKVTGNVGKFSGSEDSYSYRATKAPAGEDFKVKATIDAINITATSNPKQAAAGFMVFDEHYSKNPIEGVTTATYSNSFFVGLMTTDGVTGKIVARVRKGTDVSTTTLYTTDIKDIGTESGPIALDIRKSGDIIKVKVADAPSVDIDVTGVFTKNQYIGYAVARDGYINVSNNSVEVGSKKVASLEIANMPNKTEYYSSESFDPTGLVLNAVYEDGSKDTIENSSDYALTGFDDASTKSFTTPGERNVTVSIGTVSVNVPVTVRPMKVTSINVDYAPIYDTFHEGGKFNVTGLQVTAIYENGVTKLLSSGEYALTIGDKEVVPGVTTITSDMVNEEAIVKVSHAKTETIDPNNIEDVFYVKITPGKLDSIYINNTGFKTKYYINDKLDVTGINVFGRYIDSEGNENRQYITPDQWEVKGFDSSKFNDNLVLTIALKDNPSLTTQYTVQVIDNFTIDSVIEAYPRLTYALNEAFDINGLIYGIRYANKDVLYIDTDVVYYKNNAEFYKVNTETGERTDVTEAELLAADLYVDLSEFNNSVLGTTKVTLVLNEKYDIAASVPKVLNVSIVNASDVIWKATLFGASSLGVSGSPSSYINVNYNDGRATGHLDADNYGVAPELMENGKLDSIDSIDVVSWDGSGKISGDQDGIAYYYTQVDTSNNYTLSADITVNRYIRDVKNLTPDLKAKYDSYIASGIAPDVALDMLRSGQEAFGIMARDVVPFAGGLDEEGNYTGGSTNLMTPIAEKALKRDYTFTKADGSTVTYTTPVDLLEANLNGLVVTDNEGIKYSVSKANVETTFASNIVIAGGCTDSTWPTDPNSSSYYKKTQMNRINIMTRKGVTAPDAGGQRVGIYSTTSSLPEAGDKYNITLTKLNTGYMITTHDYQTGETVTKYSFDITENTEDVLEIQDAKYNYIGFFAARFADITVENVKFHKTNPETDPSILETVEEPISPKVTVNSSYYTTDVGYNLSLKSNANKNVLGGLASISLNGKTIRQDFILDSKGYNTMVTLVPDYVNQFSVIYYPNTADNCTSYDPVINRFTVTHKSIPDTSKLYVGPNGSVNGAGTRENPLDIETALGLVSYGGEIIMLDGTYHIINTDLGKISIPAGYSGFAGGSNKTLRADEGATPIIDLEDKYVGIECDADYWVFDGLTIINSKDNEKAFALGGQHCEVRNSTFSDNGTTGFQISRINSKDELITDWPSYNLIKSCEVYNSVDPSKNNADGFGCKLTVGYGNVFEDCIAHHNIDDGWDLYTKLNSGAIGAVTLENCIAYKNGYILKEDGNDDGNFDSDEGNGFKLGGEGIYVEHYLKDCKSFFNRNSGVTTNNNPAIIIRNLVSFQNRGKNFALYSNTGNSLVDADGNSRDENKRVYKFNYDLKGAVSIDGTDSIGSWNIETEYANISPNPISSESNYLIGSGKVPVNSLGDVFDPATDLKSTDPNVSLTKQRYSRNADGSFIHGDFLARTEEYVHDAADLVTLPDSLGNKGGIGLGGSTTTETTTETTTSKQNSSSGAGAGGGHNIKVEKYTTTESTTEVVSESATEVTTNDVVIKDSVAVKIGDKNITIGDKPYAMDVAAYIQTASNSTMVPLRFVAVAIAGGDVSDAQNSDIIAWDAVTKTATITAGENTVVFTAGSGKYVLNGVTLNISNQAVAEIVDSRMFVPFRTIGEALGANVSWDANTKTAMYN